MISSYIEFVLKPTEKIRNDLQLKVIKKGVFVTRKEKEFLDKYEDLLFKEYVLLEEMLLNFVCDK